MAAACEVYLTNDSGPMHIASALGVRTVVVFGATDEHATGPTGDLYRVVREPVECSPCLLRECPIDHRCMTRVTSDRVAEAALSLVAAVQK
jgi:heptosyltransferase-2